MGVSVAACILNILSLLVRCSPQDFGCLCPLWSTELLTLVVNRLFNVTLHSSKLHRYLKQTSIVWRRTAPTLKIKDLHCEEKRPVVGQELARKQE